jgi:hypothetical protein
VLFLLTQDIPHKKVYTRSERAKLAAAAIAVVKRSDLVHTDCFLLHEPVSVICVLLLNTASHTAPHTVHIPYVSMLDDSTCAWAAL